MATDYDYEELALELLGYGRVDVMATGYPDSDDSIRRWTANIVCSSSHAGLKPYFCGLEDEIRRVLARVDDPREVRDYIAHLRLASIAWREARK